MSQVEEFVLVEKRRYKEMVQEESKHRASDIVKTLPRPNEDHALRAAIKEKTEMLANMENPLKSDFEKLLDHAQHMQKYAAYLEQTRRAKRGGETPPKRNSPVMEPPRESNGISWTPKRLDFTPGWKTYSGKRPKAINVKKKGEEKKIHSSTSTKPCHYKG